MAHQTKNWARKGLTCSECQGRSFSDPTQPYHYPKCSQYRAWRFGSPVVAVYPEARQDLHDKALRSDSHYICRCVKPDHRDWPALCDYCAGQADFDGGE
jgi:hypothetical protein